MGFVGSDKLNEKKLGGRYLNLGEFTIASAGCRLVVASDDPVRKIGNSIATSYPNLTRQWIDNTSWGQRKPPEVVITPSGSVEAYLRLGVADTIVDIRESGQTLTNNGVVWWEEIEPINTLMTWREGQEELELDVNSLYLALRRIESRKQNGDSLTSVLLKNRNELVKKIGSEAAEFIQDLVLEKSEELVLEGQDVLYSISVALSSMNSSLIESLNIL